MAMHELTDAHRDGSPNVPTRRLSEPSDDADLGPVQVAALLRELQASSIPERGVSVAIEVDESLHVNADQARLALAVGDLLEQAITGSADGAQVVMRSRADDDGVVIEVDDESGSTWQLSCTLARPPRPPSWSPSPR